MNVKNKILIALILVLFFCGGLIFLYPAVLDNISQSLVYENPLEQAEAIVVLGGSYTGNRIEAGVELFKKGYGKKMILSGYPIYPGLMSHNAMANYAIQLGMPNDQIISEPSSEQRSTWGEGIANLNLMQTHGIKTFILVTSAYHTRRANLIYKKLNQMLGFNMKIIVFPARDPLVPVNGWWKTRAAKKEILKEYLKNFYYLFEH